MMRHRASVVMIFAVLKMTNLGLAPVGLAPRQPPVGARRLSPKRVMDPPVMYQRSSGSLQLGVSEQHALGRPHTINQYQCPQELLTQPRCRVISRTSIPKPNRDLS